MIIIGIVLVVILFWAIKSGQFDDLEGDAHRILMDEDLTPTKKVPEKNTENKASTKE
jgi:cbb3-type cytochrome oxidase maturation protein